MKYIILILGLMLWVSPMHGETTTASASIFEFKYNPKTSTLDLLNPEGTIVKSFPQSTFQRTISLNGIEVTLSYGKGARNEATVLIYGTTKGEQIRSFGLWGQKVEMSPGANLTSSYIPEANLITFSGSYVGKVLISGVPLKSGDTIAIKPGQAPQAAKQKSKEEKKTNDKQSEAKRKYLEAKKKAQLESLQKAEAAELAKSAQAPKKRTEPESDVLPQSVPIGQESKSTPVPAPQATSEIALKDASASILKEEELIRQNERRIDELEVLRHLKQGMERIQAAAQQSITILTNNTEEKVTLPPPPPVANFPLLSLPDATLKPFEKNQLLEALTKKTREDLISKSQNLTATLAQLKQILEGKPDPDYSIRPIPPQEFIDKAQQANDLFNKRDFEGSLAVYDSILKKYPKSLHALSNKSVVYFSQGKLKEAEEQLNQVLQLYPYDSFSLAILGVVQFQQKEIDKALENLSLAAAINPRDPQCRNYLGLVAAEKGWEEGAEKQFRTSIDLNPNYMDPHFNLAVLYLSQTPPSRELARRHYQEARSKGLPPNEQIEKWIETPATSP